MCVDFGAGWLWFIRSPLKNRCGKGNEMHKKRSVCVLSVSDHGFFFFFFFTIHYPRLCLCVCSVCVGEKKTRLRTGCVIIIITIIPCVQGWLPGSSHHAEGLYVYTSPPVTPSPFFTAMQTFWMRGERKIISIAYTTQSR